MNKVYQINIIQIGSGFVVQSITGDQIGVRDADELVEKVGEFVKKIVSEPEPEPPKQQTIQHFGQPEQTTNGRKPGV